MAVIFLQACRCLRLLLFFFSVVGHSREDSYEVPQWVVFVPCEKNGLNAYLFIAGGSLHIDMCVSP